jgi:hypothetical protein
MIFLLRFGCGILFYLVLNVVNEVSQKIAEPRGLTSATAHLQPRAEVPAITPATQPVVGDLAVHIFLV